jgi:hypothetical protein
VIKGSSFRQVILKRSRRLALSAALLLTLGATGPALGNTRADEAATRVADDYVAALQAGDVAAIKAMMTGRYLERHRRQLDMDGYGHRLAELYASSRHEVLGTESEAGKGATVDVSIRASDGEEYRWRLLLEEVGIDETGAPIYRIVGEEEPGGSNY